MKLSFAAATDVGRQRQHNEDNFLIDPQLNLFVVADGMGGHAAGEVASQLAIHEISRIVRENGEFAERYAKTQDLEARQAVLRMLDHAVQSACALIHDTGKSDANKRGMGTTTSALLIAGDRGFIAHVGDSRVYLLRGAQLHQLTEDHSLINELIRRGKIRRDELEGSPYARFKNAVTRAVGANESVEADTFDFEVLPGDAFLLCSDGLHQYLSDGDARLGPILSGDLEAAPSTLVELANSAGGSDNITAVVVRSETSTAADGMARVADLKNRVDLLAKLALFRYLSYKEIIRVLNVTTTRDVKPGDAIFREGESGDALYVLLAGKVHLVKDGVEVATLERGAHFGEMALVDRSPRSAAAIVADPSRVLSLSRRDFYQIVRNEPALATKLLWSFVQSLTERLRKTTSDLSDAKFAADAIELSPGDDAVFLEEPTRSRPPPHPPRV